MHSRRIKVRTLADRGARSGAALYTSVLAVALMVSVLGLTALQISDVQRRGNLALLDSSAARANARTAVELALQDLWSDANWRTRYTHGVETTPVTFGAGTLSWRLKDTTDSTLSDDPSDPVEIVGIGRVGDAACIHSVVVTPVEREIGPIELRAYVDTSNLSTGEVSTSRSWAQTFRPYLPSNASSWRVAAVDFYARQEGTMAGSTTVSLHTAASNHRPSVMLDQAMVDESALGTSLQWFRVDFTGNASLAPTASASIAFTSNGGTPMCLAIDGSGVDATNTRLVEGTPAWLNTYSSASIIYRVTGMYRVRELQVLAGSWKRAPMSQ